MANSISDKKKRNEEDINILHRVCCQAEKWINLNGRKNHFSLDQRESSKTIRMVGMNIHPGNHLKVIMQYFVENQRSCNVIHMKKEKGKLK